MSLSIEQINELQANIERLKAERDLARDQAASAAGDLEQAEVDAYQLRRNVCTWQERWEREQAEVARLKTMVAVRVPKDVGLAELVMRFGIELHPPGGLTEWTALLPTGEQGEGETPTLAAWRAVAAQAGMPQGKDACQSCVRAQMKER